MYFYIQKSPHEMAKDYIQLKENIIKVVKKMKKKRESDYF